MDTPLNQISQQESAVPETGKQAQSLVTIDLENNESIEFFEENGEIIIGALFMSMEKELVGINESPLAVYTHYTGEPAPEL